MQRNTLRRLVTCIAIIALLLFTLWQFLSVKQSLILPSSDVRISYAEMSPVKQIMNRPGSYEGDSPKYVNESISYEVDYIPEKDALRLPPCKDLKRAPSLENSRIRLRDPVKLEYSLRDSIIVYIQLYDSYGTPITRGGADIRPRMFNLERQAYATAIVYDHGNGTYTATFAALWVGRSTIKVKIAHTPETIRANYYVRRQLQSTVELEATFSVATQEELRDTRHADRANVCTFMWETTLCHPTKDALIAVNYTDVCNFTWENSGMPWYCGKPSNVHLLCEDWTGTHSKLPNPDLPLTSCESALIKRSAQDMRDSIEVYIKGARERQLTRQPSTRCSRFNTTSLWNWAQPTGFMYKNKWRLLHCKGYENHSLSPCLKNRTILLFGDSTVRQWYSHILNSWNCKQVTEKWNDYKWKKRSFCENKQHNFTVHFLPHSLPFFGTREARYTRTSISRHLDELENNRPVIALVNMYMHTLAYHHDVFRNKIQRIKRSVEHLLMRNSYAKVLIKGFATFYEERQIMSDYYRKVYKHILFEEFSGLHSKVIYLEQKDISDAVSEYGYHPSPHIVSAMVDQMLSYICD